MLELNEVTVEGCTTPLTMMAPDGEVTCLTVRGAELHATASLWLYAMMGFVPVTSGFISIDGEPLTHRSAWVMRRLMSFAPYQLDDVGEITVYHAPTADEVFGMKANRRRQQRTLEEETAMTGATGQQARLLATAVLLDRPVLTVERPQPSSMPYLHRLAEEGRTVIVASNDAAVVASADNVVEV